MKNKKSIGLDQWKLYGSLLHVLQIASRFHIAMYDAQEYKGYVIVYVPVYERHIIFAHFENCEHLCTTGMLGYLFRSLKKPARDHMCCYFMVWIISYGICNRYQRRR